MEKCVIVSAARTAVGTYLGALKTVPVQDLAAAVLRETLKRCGQVENGEVQEIIMGQALPDTESSNVARCAGLLAGLPVEVPAYTINRQCASAMQAVACGMQQIQSGHADIVLAGGCENMSRSIFYLPPSTRYEAHRMGDIKIIDSFVRGGICAQPPELYPDNGMGMTAENVAEKYGITREEMDRFALDSQRKALEAISAGRFKEEIVPFPVKGRKGDVTVFDTDEHPRPGLTMEKLAKLPPAFKKDGMVSAGNSSGMNDGASAMLLMSASSAARHGLVPMMEIVDYTVTGIDPRYMGLGPVDSVRKLLSRTGVSLEDVDLFELNEAFAAQSIGVLRELGMDFGSKSYERVNVNGGAIALGHALGNSGSRIMVTLMYEMLRQKKRLGIATLCIGGGQGMAILLKNPAAD